MKSGNSLTLSLIIFTGVILFGGAFYLASYFIGVRDFAEDTTLQEEVDHGDHPYLGRCDRNDRIYNSFEDALRNPADVCNMYVGSQGLTEVPAEIGQLKNLAYLTMVNNSLTSLPPEIGELDNLNTLFLSLNEITHLPDEIANLKNLKRLELARNPISDEEKERIRRLLPHTHIIF